MNDCIKYEDIKHSIVETTHNIKRIPVQVIKHLMPEAWYHIIAEGDDGSTLPDMYNPHISVTTHQHLLRRTNGIGPYWLCTVFYDDYPAFFFIHMWEGEALSQVYLLSKYWMQAVMRELVELSVMGDSYMADILDEGTEIPIDREIARDIANSTEPPKYEYW